MKILINAIDTEECRVAMLDDGGHLDQASQPGRSKATVPDHDPQASRPVVDRAPAGAVVPDSEPLAVRAAAAVGDKAQVLLDAVSADAVGQLGQPVDDAARIGWVRVDLVDQHGLDLGSHRGMSFR